jgi:phosphomannomutase
MPATDLSSIFKAYDVRGIYGREIDGDTAEAVGRGLARALADLSGKRTQDLRVGLGRDMRLSAPEPTPSLSASRSPPRSPPRS